MNADHAQIIQCPNCGYRHELPYQPIEKQILKAVAASERNEGKARTKAVAIRVMLSEDQTFRYLKRLEQRGQVKRIGIRGGWRSAA